MDFYLNNYNLFFPESPGELPDVSFLPPMQRRKMSALTKMSLSGAEKVLGDKKNLCLVYASRFGEWAQTLKQIQRYIEEGEISPTGFGFSVHNTAVGLLSILQKIHKPYTAVSAGNRTFDTGLIESATMLLKEQEVLYIYAGEEVPELYAKAFSGHTYRPMAMALLLGQSPASDKALRLSLNWQPENHPEADEDTLQARAFARFVETEAPSLQGNGYVLSRC